MDEILKKANQYRKDQNFAKALKTYKSIWSEYGLQFNEWDAWSYAYCLFKSKYYQEALDLCREVYSRFKHFELLRSLYARCIFYSQFKNDSNVPINTLTQALKGILLLAPIEDPYSVAPQAIFAYVKSAMKQKVIQWNEIEYWLKLINPELLTSDSYKMKIGDGRSVEIASDIEHWYANMLKVKAAQNKPIELLQLLEEVRDKGIVWHYNNDIWFARKEAFAYAQLNQKEAAVKILRQIIMQKQDWFLIYDLAKLVDDEEERRLLLCEAALAKGKPTMKLKLYESLYNEFMSLNLNKEAVLHLCLITALRRENSWDVSHSLLNEIESSGVECIKKGSSDLIRQLQIVWSQYLPPESSKQSQRFVGTIKTILPNGKSGFITSGKQSFFFGIFDVRDKSNLSIGQKVSFEVTDSFDKKKNKMSKKAVKIELQI